jgi:hypothetical protein
MTIASKPARTSRVLGIVLILLAALAAVLPELVHGNSCGHDFNFHLMSWMDALHAWRSGIFYPHWAPSANWGVGEPRFVFYPPLTWMLGAGLGSFLPWAWVPTALTFVLLAATGLGARSLAREVLTESASALAGCIAIFGGYALFTAYERTAFAELAGGLWMPLLLKFALRGRFAAAWRGWRTAFDGSAAALTVVVAGAWLSNPTVAVMACYLLVVLAICTAWVERALAPLLRAAVALVVGMGLTAVYLAPVALEQGWADLNQVNLSPGQILENNWLFARHSDPGLQFHDLVLHQVSLIVVVMVSLTLAAFVVCWLRGRLPGSESGSKSASMRWWLPLTLIPVGVLLLQLPLSHPLWVLLPKLRYLQFPWRWLVALEAPMGIFIAAAVWPRSGRWQRWLVGALAAAAFAGCVLHASQEYFQGCDQEDSVAGMTATWAAGQGFRGMDEYVPLGADNGLVASALPDACLLTNPLVPLGAAQPPLPDSDPDDDPPPPLWSPARPGCQQTFHFLPNRARQHTEHFQLQASAAQAGYLVLKLRRYPAWTLRLNGLRISDALPQRDDGLLVVPVPAGAFDLTVDWIATADVLLSRALSLFSALLLGALIFFERRLRAAQLK